MSYQFIDESATILKVIVDGDELLFKKVYCSTAVDGDYFIEMFFFQIKLRNIKFLMVIFIYSGLGFTTNFELNREISRIRFFQRVGCCFA